jgi:hypothetical protein
MINRIDILSRNNTPIRVLLIPMGEDNPNFPAASFRKTENIVEFYDLRHPFTPDGQFITRYDRDSLDSQEGIKGLDLMGYEPDWKISGRTFNMVDLWLDYHLFSTSTTSRL